MIRLAIIVAIAITSASCGKDNPRISNAESIDTTATFDDLTTDTTKLLVSQLPVKFDSTDVLLFPIRLVDLEERGAYSKTGYSSYDGSDIPSSDTYNDYLQGDFVNIVFRGKGGNERRLTDQRLKIRRVTFLRDIFQRTHAGYLLYSLFDRDSNGDKKLTYSDLEALYISKIDGSEFKKLSKELHEVYDWKGIKDENRIYFRTLEDKNKDGELNNKDGFHYYYIDFFDEEYSITEYNPIKIFQ